jgi:2-oxoglutarate ferredoxin oxidoreductase subunit alpha
VEVKQLKKLVKGNVAIAEAAIKAGCKSFFGYPITPQNELIEHMAKELPQIEGSAFVQAESEIAAINMVMGASGAGARAMTSSSGPGLSLKQEGISFIAGAELPAVIVNVMRAGPGLGGIQPAQSDYFQATKGGGHGDYNLLVYVPSSVQEAADLTQKAFDRADFYRTPTMILVDGVIGQMMEPCEIKTNDTSNHYDKSWAVSGKDVTKEKRSVIKSLYLDPQALSRHNKHLQEKFATIARNEVMYEKEQCEDAEMILVAYGTAARIARTAVKEARAKGLKVGLFRPITGWPYPYAALKEATQNSNHVMVVEMSAGQMLFDVKVGLEGTKPITFVGEMGGMMPTTAGIITEIEKVGEL